MVFAKALVGPEVGLSNVIGARLDLATGLWQELPPAPGTGFQAWYVDGLVVLNPHFTRAAGGIFDPSTDEWRPLPVGGHYDMTGVIGRAEAVYEQYEAGWVLDLPSNRWLEIPVRHGHDGSTYAANTSVGRSLFLYGGERWPDLQNDAWLWTPPPSSAEG